MDGGELGETIRSRDWSGTRFGPRHRWSPSLRMAVNIVVQDRFPMALLWGPDLLLLYNDACLPIAAARHPDALGRPARDAWPGDWAADGPALASVQKRGEAVVLEARRFSVQRGGRLEDASFDLCLSPLRQEDGAARGVLATFQETTVALERHRLLLETERQARAILDFLAEGIVLLDADGAVRHVNEAVKRTIGGSPERLADPALYPSLGLRRADGTPFPREEQPAFVALRSGQPIRDVEMAVPRPDGTLRWLSVDARPIRDAGGGIAGAVASFFDVTARKADLDAMTRLHRIASLFFKEGNGGLEPILGEIADAAIAVSGADVGTILIRDLQSAQLRMAARRGPPELAGPCSEGTCPGGTACALALERGERVVIEDIERSPILAGTPDLEVMRKAGVRAVQLTPLVSRAGHPLGVLSTYHLKEALLDERTLRMLDLLARQAADIIERARAGEALRKANERLMEEDRRKNEFLAVLSHELRNPLAPIRTSLYVLRRVPPGGEQASRAQAIIERQVEHLIRIVEDLLDLTRITHGTFQLRRERLDLNELVRSTAEDHHGAFLEGGIALEVKEARSEVWVNGDRTRLAQAIGNLLRNSARFTPRGGRTTIGVQEDLVRGEAVVSVQDSGRGLPPEMLRSVFDPFTQVDATLDRSHGGLGLGLAIVRGVVEMHGGQVGAASDGLGRGATFTIALPLETAPPAESSPRRAGTAPVASRVLIVENNVDAAESLREALGFSGHEVEVAFAGPEGLEKARTFGPDLVLCDIGLPGMDGYAVARALRADPELNRAVLVALSGYARPEDMARSREAGFDAHLAKPLSFEALQQALGQVHGVRGSGASGQE